MSYTSPTNKVNNGDSTSHDTTNVNSDDVSITNADIRWEGINNSYQDSYYNYPNNTNSKESDTKYGNPTITLSGTFPSFPSGSEFSHGVSSYSRTNGNPDVRHKIWVNGDLKKDVVRNGASPSNVNWYEKYNNRVGQTVTVELSFSGQSSDKYASVDLYINSTSSQYNTRTITEKTKNPSVSGDVSGSYSGTLNGGEWSSWQNLSGFSVGNNQFNHSIGGSNEANFQFRYYWEYNTPEPLSEQKININGTNYEVALADPNDPALDYTFYRIYDPTHGTLCYDVVEASDTDAIPYYIYHPIHGKLALRKIV